MSDVWQWGESDGTAEIFTLPPSLVEPVTSIDPLFLDMSLMIFHLTVQSEQLSSFF